MREPTAVDLPRTPRWFPGYTVAAVSAVAIIASAPGQTFLVSQLNGPLAKELGLDPLTINAAYMVATVAAAIPLVLIGSLTDRIGPRRAMALVAGAFALGCVAMASARGVVGVMIGFFLLRFLGQGALVLTAQHALAMWFHRRLGAIQGIKSTLIFGVWIPFPLLTAALIVDVGWRWTYVIFGIAIALLVIPLALRFVRDRPEDLGLRMDGDPHPVAPPPDAARAESDFNEELPEATGAGPFPGVPELAAPIAAEAQRYVEHEWTLREAGRTSAFWIITAAFFLAPLIGTALIFDMQPMLQSQSKSAVATAMPISLWTAAMALMAVPAGVLTDRLRASTLIGGGMVLIAMSPLILWWRMDPIGASIAMIVIAIGQALVGASGSAAIARYFGRRHHGAIRASIARVGVIGAGIGPLMTGVSLKFTDSYSSALFLFAAISVPVALAALRVAAPTAPRPRHDATG